MRQKVSGCSGVCYVAATGEPRRDVDYNTYLEAEEIPRYKAEEARRQKKLALEHVCDEGYLRERGWVQEGPDAWTAPEALRKIRAERWHERHVDEDENNPPKYIRIPFGYAVNTQRQEDRITAASNTREREQYEVHG
jgi:hypothetical protein